MALNFGFFDIGLSTCVIEPVSMYIVMFMNPFALFCAIDVSLSPAI